MIYKIIFVVYYVSMFTNEDKKWLEDNFATKTDLKNFATKDDLKNFATKDDLKKELEPINKNIRSIKRATTKIRKDLEMVTGEFDKEQINLKNRTERIEKHLGIQPIQ